MDDTEQKRLVLCFDGTGNKFLGNGSDTNIVKIYRMLDRKCANQYHYYQPGIGTYAQNQTSNSSTPRGLFSRLKASINFSIDQAIGTSFVHHVLAGYQFLMRYYSTGDQIYIFGFSRGAYTARFLAEMVHDIGLLSKGNEEMVHFAWNTFSDYQRTRHNTKIRKEKEDYMKNFKQTFCRPNIDVYFLGLFDCVNSVGQFEIPLFRKSSPYVPNLPAIHTRHAVSIHERRLKFKPALFELHDTKKPENSTLEEMWFPGNHADIGGGWKPEEGKRLLSDVPLKWMIEEIKASTPLAIDESKKLDEGEKLGEGQKLDVDIFNSKFNDPHDMLSFRSGSVTWLGALGWWIIEVLPFFTRLELEARKMGGGELEGRKLEDLEWVPRYWPPNLGALRDIPKNALIHESAQKLGAPGNGQIGGNGNSSLPKWVALAPLLALGILGAGAGMLRGSLF